MSEEQEAGVWLENHECMDCGSDDNLSVYEKSDGSIDAYCRTPRCGEDEGKTPYKSNNRLADTYLAAIYDIKKIERSRDKVVEKTNSKVVRRRKPKEPKKPMSHEEVHKIVAKTSAKGKSFRSQCDKILKIYNIRTDFDENSGAVSNRWYPIWKMSVDKKFPVGFKKRIVLPKKDFIVVGLNDPTVDLLGEKECLGSGKWILLQSGEEDMAAAVKMISVESKDHHAPIDVVTSSLSETGQYKQIQNKYDFFNGYDNIVIAMDNDDAGHAATERLLEILPVGKVKVMLGPKGDANDYLIGKLSKEWYSNFYAADKPKLAGIVSSSELHDNIGNRQYKDLIPLPPILHKANEMLLGGLPSDEITNILAGSGVGKSTIVDEFIYHWIRYSTKKITILSFESGSDKYSDKLISRHLGVNVGRIVDRDDEGVVLPTKRKKEQFLAKESTKESTRDLFYRDGEDAFYLIDNRDIMCNSSAIKNLIMKAITHGGSDVIIIDPIQDLLDSMKNEEQAEFCSWLKGIKKLAAIVLVNHARKGNTGQKSAGRGAELDEQDMQGTSALYKSGGVNIVLSRDKEHEDAIEKNTTKVRITKNRDGSDTGRADDLYYEVATHMLHNKEKWSENNTGGY